MEYRVHTIISLNCVEHYFLQDICHKLDKELGRSPAVLSIHNGIKRILRFSLFVHLSMVISTLLDTFLAHLVKFLT